jgi:DNA-binding CsgD family transcriptional regulator/DNA-binding Lrp family transcriptional regulator
VRYSIGAQGTAMTTPRIDIRDEGWDGLLVDVDALGVWEYLRRVGRPLPAAELAALVGMPPATVQSKLDALTARGIVEAMPASARRRSIGYRVRVEALVVECDAARDGELMRRIAQAHQRHLDEVRGAHPFEGGACPPGSWQAAFACTLPLTAEELAEIRRRLGTVVEYTELLAAKYAAPTKGTPSMANYAISFRVDPTGRPCLPQPRVVFVRKGQAPSAQERPIAEAGTAARLSRREWEVALALARGMTQAEAGRSLGISPLTAVTLTKRIYKKLGIRRRAELVSRLQTAGAPAPSGA